MIHAKYKEMFGFLIHISIILSTLCLGQRNIEKCKIDYELTSYNDNSTSYFGVYFDNQIKSYKISIDKYSEIITLRNFEVNPYRLNLYLKSGSIKSKILDIDEWNSFDLSEEVTIEYIKNSSNVILGYDCQRIIFKIQSMPIAEMDVIKDIYSSESLLFPSFKKFNRIPLRIKLFNDKGGQEYKAIDIDFNPADFNYLILMSYKEMTIDNFFEKVGNGNFDEFYKLFGIFEP